MCGPMMWPWPMWWRLADSRGQYWEWGMSTSLCSCGCYTTVGVLWGNIDSFVDFSFRTLYSFIPSGSHAPQESPHHQINAGVPKWRLRGGAWKRTWKERLPPKTWNWNLLYSAISPTEGIWLPLCAEECIFNLLYIHMSPKQREMIKMASVISFSSSPWPRLNLLLPRQRAAHMC